MPGSEVRREARRIAELHTARGDGPVMAGVSNRDLKKYEFKARTWQDDGVTISQANRNMSATRREILDKRRSKDKGKRYNDESIGEIVEVYRNVSASVDDRVQNGDSYPGGYIDGRYVPPCPPKRGTVSSLSPILKLLASKSYKGRFRTGWTGKDTIPAGDSKAYVLPCPRKILALDAAYNEYNDKMRGELNIDVDRTFKSVRDLMEQVLAQGCPLPNTVVHESNAKGEIINPHLCYVIKDSVCFTENGSPMAMNLLRKTHKTLYHKLEAIGADPNATNSIRAKNPLSRLWHKAVIYQQPYSLGKSSEGLESLADLLEVYKHREKYLSSSFLVDLNLAVEQRCSNALFTVAGTAARRLIPHFHPESKRRRAVLAADRDRSNDDLYAEFEHALYKILQRYFDNADKVKKQAKKTAEFYWRTFNPARASDNRRRGAMLNEPSYLQAESTKEKQQAGARYSSRLRRDHALIKMAEAAEIIGQPGESIGPTELARASGLSRQTIWRHKDCHEEARRLHAEYKARGPDRPEDLLVGRRSATTVEANSERNIECLDKRVMDLPEGQEANGAVETNPDSGPAAQKTRSGLALDTSRAGENRTTMGEGARSYEIHARNPVFMMTISAGYAGDVVTMVPLDPNIPPMVFDSVIATALDYIDDFGREFMGDGVVINGLDGSVVWRNPDLSVSA